MALAIVHRETREDAIPAGALTWRTCLREVTFGSFSEDLPTGDGRRLSEGDAYRLLLEILCGLQSPMLGETQVLGQFKTFLTTIGPDHGWLTKLGQRLLTDAREVRTEHLQGLGSRSYGSAVRRYLAGCSRAVLLGTGKLAQEVLPFLDDNSRTVDHWGRREDAGTSSPAVTYRLLDQVDGFEPVTDPAVIIIAAPVAAEVINAIAARYSKLSCVVDLRAESAGAPVTASAPIVSLQDLFAAMRDANAFAARHVDAARADIARRSRLYELREELRPFGWDDLCA